MMKGTPGQIQSSMLLPCLTMIFLMSSLLPSVMVCINGEVDTSFCLNLQGIDPLVTYVLE